MRLEGRQSELERDARGREAPFPQLGGDPFGLGSERRPEELGVRAVSTECFLGPDRLRQTEGLDRTAVAAEREDGQALAALSEPPRQDGARPRLEPPGPGEA